MGSEKYHFPENDKGRITETKKSQALVLHQWKTLEGAAFIINECEIREKTEK